MESATTPAFLLEPEPLLALARERAEEYRSAEPFPHIVLDDFLPEDVVDACIEEFPTPGGDLTSWEDTGTAKKFGVSDEAAMGAMTRQVVAQLNSGVMIRFLEELTGISGLVPDPYLEGGGIHVTGAGGYLKVHADFNVHHGLKLDRRINVLLYFNPGWQEDWGGSLELWTPNMTSCARRVVPIANRCVIFNTTDVALHGNPEPVRSPDGQPRRSLAFYYYTAGRPRSERTAAHTTLYPERGQRAKPTMRNRVQSLKDRSVLIGLRWLPPIVVDAIRRLRGAE